ncbi:MAG TPA: hypothetical protein VGJ80_07185 [Gemmatimonadales bacterium]|jgi:uncharacterized circularly permuted ATP-grasp superfamily protein
MTLGLPEAIARYHELLTDDIAAESQAMLDEEQRRRGVYFGARPLCTALRPRFLTSDQYRYVRERCAVLLRAMRRLHQAALASEPLRRQFRLTEWEEELVALDPGIPEPSPTSRFDSFYFPDTGALWLTEYNAETPTGAAYGDTLADVFLALPVMRQFLRSADVRPVPGRHGILHALLASYSHWKRTRSAPRIAILDWREVPTYSEFVLFQQYFESHGLDAVIVDPRETEFRAGRLIAAGAPVDLIYKRVLISELVARCGLDHAVVRAVRSGAVCMVNGFRCKLLHKKVSFAVLCDERNVALFPAEERQAIDAHIPWTRLLEERKTQHGGKEVDLVPFVLSQRERLVLKPNDEYGGKGIVLGWEVSDVVWEQQVRVALRDPHVVQERVPVPREPYPSFVDGALQFADRIVDTDPFACQGEYVDGCLSRLSTAALVNVTAGGGSQVPTMLVESR